MKRRDFLKLSATSLGALGAAGVGATPTASAAESPATFKPARARGKSKYNAEYSGARLNRVAFPMGGMGALKAATLMGRALGEDVPLYAQLLEKGLRRMESELFDGEYFIQKVEWKNLRAKSPLEAQGGYSPEARELLEKEGPKYQYGKGCLSDGVLGAWLALVCGVGQVVAAQKVASHLKAIHRYNLKPDLTTHPNPQRPSYACGPEGGLLLCTWPKGGELSLPFVYSNEKVPARGEKPIGASGNAIRGPGSGPQTLGMSSDQGPHWVPRLQSVF